MEITLETVVFYFLAVFITVCSILTVTTRRMVRSATYLLFTLFGHHRIVPEPEHIWKTMEGAVWKRSVPER